MTQIHWAFWIGIGAIVTAMSTYMGPKFRLFFWFGLFMVAFGVFKVIVRYVVGADPSLKKEHKPLPKNPSISRCPNCRASVYTTAKFCHMCGMRLQ